MEINGFVLDNKEKVGRAIKGTEFRHKGIVEKNGGLPENYTPEQLLAEYDRLGGLILKDGVKVKTGSFYDFEKKAPKEQPDIKFIDNVEGEQVELSEDEAKSLKKAKEKIKEVKVKKAKKLKKLEQ